jgi:uncharacterized membrane protein YraQ (UPF0718 family)/copper chaperone CopZ
VPFLEATWSVLLELAPWLLLGVAVAALLHAALPRDFVRRHLGGTGKVGRAVLLGVPLPLCSCGVIPAGLGLRKDGASDGASVGFLIATPQTGVDSFLVSGSLLGWPFAAFKVGSAALLGWIGGRIVDASGPPPAPVAADEPRDGSRPGLRAGASHGLDVLRSIWGWIVVGVLVSAALTTLVPAEAMHRFAELGGGWLAPLTVLALSVPLYVCATASVPIAAALVAGGFPPGAALVFLMAGPATNVATLGAVKGAFGKRVLAIYLVTIVIGSLGLAWLFDFVISPEVAASVHAGAHHGGPVAIAAAVVLVGLLAVFAGEELRALFAAKPAADAGLKLSVEGLTCGGCVRKLEGALGALEGVEAVTVDRGEDSSGTATVQGQVDPAALQNAVRGAGFSVVER